jgi:dTMP kinase
MKKGIFIVIEGIDGTGKSTQSKRLAEWFRAQGCEVVLSREPTDGPWGKKLRESATTGRLSPDEELEYFLNDRREHVETKIKPALADGKVVILDRYYFSTMAYQGARGFDPALIRQRNEEFATKPDLLLILDLSVESAHKRIGARGDTVNEFEQLETLTRCREIFLSIRDESFARVIDAEPSLDVVSADILSVVTAAFPDA